MWLYMNPWMLLGWILIGAAGGTVLFVFLLAWSRSLEDRLLNMRAYLGPTTTALVLSVMVGIVFCAVAFAINPILGIGVLVLLPGGALAAVASRTPAA